jgi:hypothetical protein
MTLSQVSAKIDARLNKSASGDYDNIWPYQKQEAFNKAVTDWVRRQKFGKNQTQEGDEETDKTVDDLQVLLKQTSLSVINKKFYVQTEPLPSDYLYYKRLSPIVTKDNCKNVRIKSHLREEANVDELITVPSFDFEETFHTLIGNRAHVYHNNDFKVESVQLVYYKKPKVYDFTKPSSIVEFKDDVCELFVDECCKILSSDIESINQKFLAQERTENNT